METARTVRASPSPFRKSRCRLLKESHPSADGYGGGHEQESKQAQAPDVSRLQVEGRSATGRGAGRAPHGRTSTVSSAPGDRITSCSVAMTSTR